MARIQVSKDSSGRIIVSFPYDPLLVLKVKTINDRRWHPVEKHWSFPHLCGMLEKILKVFGDEEIHLDPPLKTATSKIKDTPSPLGPKGTVPDFVVSAQSTDLQTPYTSPPPRWGRERVGVKKLESGLSLKFAFEDLRRELVSRKYSYTPHFCKSAGYIQELLGHSHSKTTEIYTHVSTKSLGKILSPLDTLELPKGGDE